MNTTINERLSELIKELGYNPHSFTKKLGLGSTSTIPNILGDHSRKPSFDVLEKIGKTFPNVDMNWLIYGNSPYPLVNDTIYHIVDVETGVTLGHYRSIKGLNQVVEKLYATYLKNAHNGQDLQELMEIGGFSKEPVETVAVFDN